MGYRLTFAALAVLLAVAVGTGAGQVVPDGCACTDVAPDDQYTCEQQKSFGKCTETWMKDASLCAYTCGECVCEDSVEEPAAADTADAPEDVAEADVVPVATEAADAIEELVEEEEETAELATPKPAKKSKKKSTKTAAVADSELADPTDVEADDVDLVSDAVEEDEDDLDTEDVVGDEVEEDVDVIDAEEDVIDADAEEDVVDAEEDVIDADAEEDVVDAEEDVLDADAEEDIVDAEEDVIDADAEAEVVDADAEEDIVDADAEADAVDADAEDTEVEEYDGETLEDFADKKRTCAATVGEVIAQAADTELFYALVSGAGLTSALEGDADAYTVFIPTNKAVENGVGDLGFTIEELLENYIEKVATIVNYHIVDGIKTPEDLKDPSLIETLASDPLVGGSSSEIEGLGSSAKLVSKPIPVCKSTLYLVDNLLLPAYELAGISPKDEVAEASDEVQEEVTCQDGFDGFFGISQDPELSILTETLNRYSLSEGLADAAAEYTFLAPTDAAFEKMASTLGITVEEFLDDVDNIVGILDNHILAEVYEGQDLTAEASAELVSKNGSTIALETNAKGTVIDLFAAGSSAKVLETDIDEACVAAVHKISGVLLPYSTGSGTNVKGVSVPQKPRKTAKAKEEPAKVAVKEGECQVGSWSVFEVLNQMAEARVFTSILQQAKLTKIFTNKAVKVTIFAPVDYAFGNILPEGKGFFDLVPEQILAENLVSNHIVGRPLLTKSFEGGLEVTTALTKKGKPLPLEIEEDSLSFPLGLTVSTGDITANIIKGDIIACNSVIHMVDTVLTPSAGVLPSKTVTVAKAVAASKAYGSLLTAGAPAKSKTPKTARTG